MSFRAYTVEQAKRHGVTGWVRNELDGSVVLEAQGRAADVEALLEWCKGGPPGARVTAMQSEWIDVIPGESSFRIRF